jgi:hypothetical protein
VSRLAAFAALLLVMTSAPARADGFLTPFIGYNFGGDSSNCAGLTDCSPRRTSYGVSVGAMGTSVGFEEDRLGEIAVVLRWRHSALRPQRRGTCTITVLFKPNRRR